MRMMSSPCRFKLEFRHLRDHPAYTSGAMATALTGGHMLQEPPMQAVLSTVAEDVERSLRR